MPDYLNVIYDEKSHPFTDYPSRLAAYLYQAFKLNERDTMLELGSGRGEMLKCFSDLGMTVKGVDLSQEAQVLSPGLEMSSCDLETEKLPFPDSCFDVVFNKSVLEHIRNTDHLIREIRRVLKPGGLILCMVPDWESNYKIFFDDYTHKSPFTTVSLNDLLRIHDFVDVRVYKFRQLPIVWRHPWLNFVCALMSPFVPIRTNIGFLRWSRELMIVACGTQRESEQ